MEPTFIDPKKHRQLFLDDHAFEETIGTTAAEADLVIPIETEGHVHHTVAPTATLVREMVEATGRDNVKVNLDTGHAFINGGLEEEFTVLRDHIVHVHLNDGPSAPEILPAGGSHLRFDGRAGVSRESTGRERADKQSNRAPGGRRTRKCCDRRTWRHSTGLRHVSYRTYTSSDWCRPRVSHSTLRFLDADSLFSFITEAGLRIEQQFGEWDHGPLTDASPEIISITRRAEVNQ